LKDLANNRDNGLDAGNRSRVDSSARGESAPGRGRVWGDGRRAPEAAAAAAAVAAAVAVE